MQECHNATVPRGKATRILALWHSDIVAFLMEDRMNKTTVRFAASAATLVGIVAVCGAQQPAVKRTQLQRGDLSAPGREAVMAIAEFPAGTQIGKHTHPGEEISYVLEGTLSLEVDGKAPATLKAGDYFLIPAGQAHNARNTTSGAAKVLATYIVEKGKPLATPVQ